MKRYNNTAAVKFDTINNGNSDSLAPITVRLSSTGAKVDVYSENNTTPESLLDNPFMADEDGNYGFYVEDGVYDIYINEGMPREVLIPDEEIIESLSPGLINDLSQAYDFETRQLMIDSAIVFPARKRLHVINTDADYKVTAGSSPNVGSPELTGGGYAALSQKGDVIALHWGIEPGVTVDVPTFKAMVAYSTSTKTNIQFRAGTYDFNGQDISDGGLSRGQDVGDMRFIGGIGRTTIFANIGSAHYGNYIFSRDVYYKDCVQPLYFTGALTKVDIQNNEFSGNLRSIYHNDSAAGASYDNVTVDNNTFRDTQKDDFVGCILFHRAPEGKNATANNNKFINVQTDPSGSSVVLLCQFGVDTATAVDDYSNIRFNGNYITGCGNPNSTYQGSPSFGCVIIGRDSEQNDNVIENNFWLEPVYFKGDGNSQISNRLRDNQFSGLSMKVVSTTNTSKENIQDNNIISGQCDIRAAVRMFGSGRSINSQVNITTTSSVASQGGLAFQATRSTSIGKLTVTGDFIAPKGIQINTAGDIDLNVSLISQTNGISVIKSTDGNLGLVSVCGKVVCNDQAINVNWAEKISFEKGLELECNRSDGNSVFIYSQKKTDLSGMSLHVTDNDADGLPINTPIGLFAKDGGTTDHLTIISNFTFLTDRNLTQVFQYNADATLAANKQGQLQIIDSDINLNSKSCTNLVRATSDMKKASFRGVELDDQVTQILSAGGVTINRVIARGNLFDSTIVDNNTLAGITGATVLTSDIGNNETA